MMCNHLNNVKKHLDLIAGVHCELTLLPQYVPVNSLFLPTLATLYLVMLCLLVCGVLLQLTEGSSH